MSRQTVGMRVPEQTRCGYCSEIREAVEDPEWENAIRAGMEPKRARPLNEMYRVLGGEQSSVASSPISQKFLDQLTTWRRSGISESWTPHREYPACCGPGCSAAGRPAGARRFQRLGAPCSAAAVSAVAVLLGLLLFIVSGSTIPSGTAGRHFRTVRAITERLRLEVDRRDIRSMSAVDEICWRDKQFHPHWRRSTERSCATNRAADTVRGSPEPRQRWRNSTEGCRTRLKRVRNYRSASRYVCT